MIFIPLSGKKRGFQSNRNQAIAYSRDSGQTFGKGSGSAFGNTCLENLLDTSARRYALATCHQNPEAGHIRLTGNVPRMENFHPLPDTIESRKGQPFAPTAGP